MKLRHLKVPDSWRIPPPDVLVDNWPRFKPRNAEKEAISTSLAGY